MNKYGETIVLKVNKDKCLAGFYALGFEPKEIMGVLYQAITVLCKEEEVDPQEAYNYAWSQIANRKGKTIDGVFIKEADLKGEENG